MKWLLTALVLSGCAIDRVGAEGQADGNNDAQLEADTGTLPRVDAADPPRADAGTPEDAPDAEAPADTGTGTDAPEADASLGCPATFRAGSAARGESTQVEVDFDRLAGGIGSVRTVCFTFSSDDGTANRTFFIYDPVTSFYDLQFCSGTCGAMRTDHPDPPWTACFPYTKPAGVRLVGVDSSSCGGSCPESNTADLQITFQCY